MWTLSCDFIPHKWANETLQWLSSLPGLMQERFWWWQCSDRYIISLFFHLHFPPSSPSPSLISLMVSVDVKHNVLCAPLNPGACSSHSHRHTHTHVNVHTLNLGLKKNIVHQGLSGKDKWCVSEPFTDLKHSGSCLKWNQSLFFSWSQCGI